MPPGWARKGGNGLSREENGLNGLSEQHFPIYFFPQSHFEAFSPKFRGLMPTQLARLSPGDLKLHCVANGACMCLVRAVHFKKLSSVVPLAFLKKKIEKFLDFNTMFLL
jgi:hypothetical protein